MGTIFRLNPILIEFFISLQAHTHTRKVLGHLGVEFILWNTGRDTQTQQANYKYLCCFLILYSPSSGVRVPRPRALEPCVSPNPKAQSLCVCADLVPDKNIY